MAHGVGSGVDAHEWADVLGQPDVLYTLALAMAKGRLERARLADASRRYRRDIEVWQLNELRQACDWLALACRVRGRPS